MPKCVGRFLIVNVLVATAALAGAAPHRSGVIDPGSIWLDNRGREIQAHGGGILHLGKTYYWFGEDRSQDNDPGMGYVTCYSSTDLAHWRFRGQVFKLANPEDPGSPFVLERPKVFYNQRTKRYVMYMHFDDSKYKLARVGVAVSDKVDGPYRYLRSFRPLGQESRDIGQFVDDDGSAYLIFESRPTHGFFIAKLSDDYLNVEKEVSFIPVPLEGGALVHYKGFYYVLGSHLTGWHPNPNVYAVAPTLAGPWTAMKDIAPPETNTYDSQSSMLIKVDGKETETVIYMGDRWNPQKLWDSRYIWMPLEMGDGTLHLPEPRPWSIDIKTGEITKLGSTDAGDRRRASPDTQ
ncbi:MAG TPA: family 43 glycosylhydrolase [Acidobacteriaceae bacterium]|nr:family 43 glycosylhydrolase [Acidobacteriaceae bacterium]